MHQQSCRNPYRGDYRSKLAILGVSIVLIFVIGVAVSLISMPTVSA